ncbi:hypothetical protein CMQ_3450 [Grosmannia clavigera kw1407]|uniref:Uncharacterized protein n=1 Tax=Grosmannia clavigera (strain kw1407 / UAMH 11150) TaxID=655863 RepID=F0X816_GROCL|nr:uncharacterized protein CMQ_3450 [Grosmannia clavigera kw1407]EFX05381.1 hypothetical protein CMQ_3450 [Grosmannia clavigera kw1407]
MAELPSPYECSHNAGAMSAVTVSPPVAVLSSTRNRHPSPPPSYETAVRKDRAALSAGETRPRHLDGQQSQQSQGRKHQKERDRQILERVLHKNGGGGGCRGITRDRLGVALHDMALAGNEAAVQALLRAYAPIVFTDSGFVAKRSDGCTLHAAL